MAIELDNTNLGLKASGLFLTCTHEVFQALLFFLLLYNLGCFKPLEFFLCFKLGALKPPNCFLCVMVGEIQTLKFFKITTKRKLLAIIVGPHYFEHFKLLVFITTKGFKALNFSMCNLLGFWCALKFHSQSPKVQSLKKFFFLEMWGHFKDLNFDGFFTHQGP